MVASRNSTTELETSSQDVAHEESSSVGTLAGVGLVMGVAVLLVCGVLGVAVWQLSRAPESEVHVFEIAEGTNAALLSGDATDVLPTVLEVNVGDTLKIVNHDWTNHTIGPYTVRPNDSIEINYERAGVFPGTCTINASGSTEIRVNEV